EIRQKIQSIRLCVGTVDFHCRWTLSAGMACASVCFALRGLKTHGTALSFVPPKTFCYSRKTRRAPEALHRTKKIGLYFRVAAFRSNQRCRLRIMNKLKRLWN